MRVFIRSVSRNGYEAHVFITGVIIQHVIYGSLQMGASVVRANIPTAAEVYCDRFVLLLSNMNRVRGSGQNIVFGGVVFP